MTDQLHNNTKILTHLPYDLHAHADGRVAVAADEAQVRLAHQALKMKLTFINRYVPCVKTCMLTLVKSSKIQKEI